MNRCVQIFLKNLTQQPEILKYMYCIIYGKLQQMAFHRPQSLCSWPVWPVPQFLYDSEKFLQGSEVPAYGTLL